MFPILRLSRSLSLSIHKGLFTPTAASSSQAQVLDNSTRDDVTKRISNTLKDTRNRLFAVVYVNEKQFKVGANDIISLEGNLPLKVGDEITLDKVLLVGGSSFTIYGRPLLNPSHIKVMATVVEKTTKAPELNYAHYNHAQIRVVNWLSTEMTILRINSIEADPSLIGGTQ